MADTTATPKVPRASNRQRIVIGIGVVIAFGALVLAGVYSGERTPSAPILSGSAADGGGERGAEAVPLDVDPIQGWFPQSGIGSTCTEPVGVDLIPGYSAILTINGVTITEDETNVRVDTDGDGVKDAFSSGGSQGQVTWGPEPDCPNGSVLRPQGNVVEACIYRLVDGPETCRVGASFQFDAL